MPALELHDAPARKGPAGEERAMRYLKNINTRVTPQGQAIPGAGQVPNSAGGYGWAVDYWMRLDRFLILGSEGGSYYASETRLTAENAEAVRRCIEANGERAVRRIVEISEAGRAPKNDPALFALAMAAGLGDEPTRKLALASLPRVARTGTHLFHFAAFVEQFRGWGRALREAVAAWYNALPADRLAYQTVKYRQRDGWGHRDLLRLAHPQAASAEHQAIYRWITQGDRPVVTDGLELIGAFAEIQRATTGVEAARLIRDYRLPREAVPSELLADQQVWEALLEDMPMTALIRNLATLTRVGLLTPGAEATRKVIDQFGDGERLRKARVHPIAVLTAMVTYAGGRGARGRGRWEPVAEVVDALDAAFYASFGNFRPSGKRVVLALDVSGSMTMGAVVGVPGLSPRIAAAAMALVTAATERNYTIVAFSQEMVPVAITPRMRLDDVVRATSNLPFGGTDCALPMLWALERKVKAELFAVYTDSETWFGKIHPSQALVRYREQTGIPARLAVVGMVSNGFTIADPNDAGMLDVVGFDTATPEIISGFARDELRPSDEAAA